MTNLYNTYNYEYTDTFGGETNYSWVKGGKINVSLNTSEGSVARAQYNRRLKKQAKAAVGLAGVRGIWEDSGAEMIFRPTGICAILFITTGE